MLITTNNRRVPLDFGVFICVILVSSCQCHSSVSETGINISNQTNAPQTDKTASFSTEGKSTNSELGDVSVQDGESSTKLEDGEVKVSQESIEDTLTIGGWIKVGIKQNIILEKLGPPEKKTEMTFSESTGMFEQTWWYSAPELALIMEAPNSDSQMSVYAVRISPPSKLKTLEGIGIGSEYSKVKSIYADRINPEYSDENRIVIGTIYLGTIMHFKENKIYLIFIGSAAE